MASTLAPGNLGGLTMQFRDLTSPHTNVLAEASAIVGDSANNLRSALDYPGAAEDTAGFDYMGMSSNRLGLCVNR